MNYRSVAQLTDAIWAWSKALPKDIDLVVGIPRSGLLAANLLALYLNLPFTDLDGFLAGRILAQGKRRMRTRAAEGTGDRLRVLVVDDSVCRGAAMEDARARIVAAGLPHDVLYGAVYVKPGSERHVDFFAELLDTPRRFEWNILHWGSSTVCMSVDGVLCAAPLVPDDDADRYRASISSALPLHVPSTRVNWLVTCRPEMYRAETEAWLSEHNIEYGELIMLDSPENGVGQAACPPSVFKADVYRRTSASVFVESSLNQSVQIAGLAQRPVFCVDTRQMIYPDSVPRSRYTQGAPGKRRSIGRRLRKRFTIIGRLFGIP